MNVKYLTRLIRAVPENIIQGVNQHPFFAVTGCWGSGKNPPLVIGVWDPSTLYPMFKNNKILHWVLGSGTKSCTGCWGPCWVSGKECCLTPLYIIFWISPHEDKVVILILHCFESLHI